MRLLYHTTVTSALQAVLHLARASPYVAVIDVPILKAVQVAQRQVHRHPSITALHTTRSALRRVGMPAVQLVILPPVGDTVTMLLLSNLPPPGSRETWRLALDKEQPLTWRNYELMRQPDGRLTWRLSQAARHQYRQRLARLIAGRGRPLKKGKRPYQLPPEVARQQVLRLAAHLQHYPGFSGVREDVFDLAQYSTKIWNSTHAQGGWVEWPRMPYLRFVRPQTAPLHTLKESQYAQKEEDRSEP